MKKVLKKVYGITEEELTVNNTFRFMQGYNFITNWENWKEYNEKRNNTAHEYDLIKSRKLIDLIPQNQDVDGLTATNMGMLVQNNRDAIIPATANACYYVMKHFFDQEDMSNINVTIVNRSRLIGLPLQALLTNNNATVTLCHSKTRKLPVPMITSDVLITGIGKSKFFTSQDCSDEYQLIIDCGINRDEDGKMCGDWNEESLFEVCDDSVHLTPVGKKRAGVGSIVTACLMQSVLKCHKLQGGE